MEKLKQQIIKAVDTKRTTLKVLGSVLVKDGVARISNLETTVEIKTDLPDGVYKKTFLEKGLVCEDKEIKESDFHKLPKIEGGVYKVLKPEVIEAMKTAVNYTGTDDFIPVLTGVYFGAGICGTDAHKLYFKSIDTELETEVILTREAVKLLSLAKSKVMYRIEGSRIVFFCSEFIANCNLIEGKYPNFRAVLPKDNDIEFSIDRKELIKTLERLKEYANRTTRKVVLTVKHNEALLEAEDEDNLHGKSELLKAETDKVGSKIAFNCVYLLKIIKGLNTDKVLFSINEITSKAILINKDSLLMPIQL
jgi:DNA polymerase III sliding clamp (beta) subunit (PCNA family)